VCWTIRLERLRKKCERDGRSHDDEETDQRDSHSVKRVSSWITSLKKKVLPRKRSFEKNEVGVRTLCSNLATRKDENTGMCVGYNNRFFALDGPEEVLDGFLCDGRLPLNFQFFDRRSFPLPSAFEVCAPLEILSSIGIIVPMKIIVTDSP